jgi:hypothetical protein
MENLFLETLLKSIENKEFITSDAVEAIEDHIDFIRYDKFFEKDERKELIKGYKMLTDQDIELIDLFIKEYQVVKK